MSEKPWLVVLVGPTAVGKTRMGVALAKLLNGVVISADSRLFYKGMDIGTAKPTPEEREGVPHYLIDIARPDETFSLAKFQQEAYRAIDKAVKDGKLPILVGGTGQYIRAVTEGWLPPALEADPAMRRALESWMGEVGAQSLHARLARLDPAAASAIDWRNKRRTIRALEVIFKTGRRFSAQREKIDVPFRILQVGLSLPRVELYRRIDERIESMFATGLVEEVQGLLDKGYPSSLPAFSAIGYRQVIDYIQGKCSLEDAKVLMRRLTRQYVRRQANWFPAEEPSIHWFDMRGEVTDSILALIHSEIDRS